MPSKPTRENTLRRRLRRPRGRFCLLPFYYSKVSAEALSAFETACREYAKPTDEEEHTIYSILISRAWDIWKANRAEEGW